jgi:predicted Rossmann-fold nucleotide-binding protein
MLTWSQLGIHAKPVGVLNVSGFYDQLVGFLRHAHDQAFIKPEHAGLMMVESDPEALVKRLMA